jgi:hypothetical protein
MSEMVIYWILMGIPWDRMVYLRNNIYIYDHLPKIVDRSFVLVVDN